MWKNVVLLGRARMIIWRMRFACWITKTTDTHSEYVTLIALPRQKIVTRTRLKVTLYVHCLSCYVLRIYRKLEDNIRN